MSKNEQFVSVEDFALLTGLSAAEIEGRYTVRIGAHSLVPRFMLEDTSLSSIAHIELPPDNTTPTSQFTQVATLCFDPGDFEGFELNARANSEGAHNQATVQRNSEMPAEELSASQNQSLHTQSCTRHSLYARITTGIAVMLRRLIR